MIAHFGYQDGSGAYFITIDTDKCNGCGDCLPACPAQLFEILVDDPNDPFRVTPVASVKETERKKIKYICDPCKGGSPQHPLLCVASCKAGAIGHS